MLDRLPPGARHGLMLVIVAPVSLALTFVAALVIESGGVTGVDWPAVARVALDAGAVSAAGGVTAFLALYITPLTRAYGLGKTNE